jgi:hypothetical protein
VSLPYRAVSSPQAISMTQLKLQRGSRSLVVADGISRAISPIRMPPACFITLVAQTIR